MTDATSQSVLEDIAVYYSEKLAQYGPSARGVDWNSTESQTLRFEQLSKVIRPEGAFSVNDLGCGYGSYFEYLSHSYENLHYFGFDLSPDMVAAAQNRFAGRDNAAFAVSSNPDEVADYGIASGIFNVRLGTASDDWKAHILRTLDVLDRTSRRGFAFNCLTSYSDRDRMREYLYYANPTEFFDHCKRSYSRDVALLHDYGLYEFTILVRKS